MIDENLEKLKKNVETARESFETGIFVSTQDLRDLIQRVETADQQIEWLERKKRTIADLTSAGHNWSKAKLELADKRILHIEEILETGQNVFNNLTDATEFKRGYRAALYWFRSEILEDELFEDQKKAAEDAQD